MDLALTATGDLDVVDGMSLVTGTSELQQNLTVGLTINLNEFFTHQNYGLPWLREEGNTDSIQYFLGDSETTVQYIISEIENYIESIEKVGSVSSNYSFNKSQRELSYTPKIVSVDGDVIEFPAYILNI